MARLLHLWLLKNLFFKCNDKVCLDTSEAPYLEHECLGLSDLLHLRKGEDLEQEVVLKMTPQMGFSQKSSLNSIKLCYHQSHFLSTRARASIPCTARLSCRLWRCRTVA